MDKQCTKCHRLLPADTAHFRVCAKAKDGLSWYCCECMNAASKASRARKLEYYQVVNRAWNYRHLGFSADEAWTKAGGDEYMARQSALHKEPVELGQQRKHHNRLIPPVAKWNLETDDLIIQHYGIGMTLPQLSECIGKSEQEIRGRAATLGLRLNGKDWRAESDFIVPKWAKVA